MNDINSCPYCSMEKEPEAVKCNYCNSGIKETVDFEKDIMECYYCGKEVLISDLVCIHCNTYLEKR